MPTYRKWLTAFCVVLLLLLPFSMLLVSVWKNGETHLQNFSSSDYFAMTDPVGNEYVFSPSDALFSDAAFAFSSAVPMGDASDHAYGEDRLLVEWIKDGRSDRFFLAYAPDLLTARLTDAEGNSYVITDDAALVFLATEAGKAVLVGEDPPALTVNGREIPYAIIEWTGTFTKKNGQTLHVTSGAHRTAHAPHRITALPFSPIFDRAPARTEYLLYAGEDLIAETGEPLSFADLEAGEYQLVTVAEWTNGALSVRAGYSFVFTVA